MFDQNGDGFITKNELTNVMTALSHPDEGITSDEIDEMMGGHEKLNQEEFEIIIGNMEHPTSKIQHKTDTNMLTIVETSESHHTLSQSASRSSYKNIQAENNTNNNTNFNNNNSEHNVGVLANLRRALFCGLFTKINKDK